MQFGLHPTPEIIDFTLPADAPETKNILQAHKTDAPFEAFVGCAKWNKNDLKGFYPKGIKDELTYYSRQFNAIELNPTFHSLPTRAQLIEWKNKTPDDFKFFPKINRKITHENRLQNVKKELDDFCDLIRALDPKLGMAFLQVHDNFTPAEFDRLKIALEGFPANIPLSVEVRNNAWFSNKAITDAYCTLLEGLGMSNTLVDTAGRRDIMHMRLTSPVAFIRYVSANHPTDIDRLNDWIIRLKKWRNEGLQKLYFFVHQHDEMESALLATHFIMALNKAFDLSLTVPKRPPSQGSMFD